jgi:Domain of unknown function (DUF5916)/Carbohydrate family 9 binding domain-like
MKQVLAVVAPILCLCLFFSSIVAAQNPEKKNYKAVAITTAPIIDGILDDEAWQHGHWIGDFIQNQPFEGAPTTQKTEFNIVFDEDNLYVAFKAYDTSPDSIVRRLTRRDQIDGDMVGLAIDSYHDQRTAFMFSVSAGGVKFDQMLTENGDNEDESWDPNWWVKVSTNEEGFVAEMKIPFSQLRFGKNAISVWGLEVFRQIYREDEMDFWQHIPQDAPGLVHMFGEMSGVESIKPKKIFDITPYGVAKAERYESESGNPFADGKDAGLSAGVDAKIGVTNNLTLDLTINPDFGQVEADPSEVNLSAYETFFEEKRPFFIEGANITNFGIGIGDGGIGNDNLFYSRRIGRRPSLYPDMASGEYAGIPQFSTILGASKLTGKTSDGLSIGFIESVTAKEMAEIDNDGERRFETVEPLTNYFVGRVQKDFDEGNTLIGGMVTGTNRFLEDNTKDYLHKSAYTGGIDFTKYWQEKAWSFNVNAAFSEVSGTAQAIEATQKSSARYFQRAGNDYVNYDPTRTSLFGSGGRMQLLRQKGHWTAIAVLLWKTPGFELNDIGYLRQADQIFSLVWAQYRVWEPKKFYRSYSMSADHYRIWDFGGNHLGDGLEANAGMDFKNFWYMNLGTNVNLDGISNTLLRGGPGMRVPGSASARTFIRTDRRKKISFNVFANLNRGFEGSSDSWYIEGGVTLKPINTLSLSINPGYNASFDQLQYITQKSYKNEDRYLFGSIDRKTVSASIRISLNITPDLTLQYWGQPFVATGKYRDFKYISDPMASNYHSRFATYSGDQIAEVEDEIMIDENKDGVVDYDFGNQDFNVQEFLSNFVVRWEYNPGSSVYLVWNQTRSGFNSSGSLDVTNDLGDLFGEKPYNIFLVKFSYRFGL